MSERRTKKAKPAGVHVPLRMSAELEAKVESASEKVNLSKQDVMRLAIERGLEVLITQLTTPPATSAAA